MQLAYLSFTAPRLDRKAYDIWRESALEEVRLARNKPEVRFGLRLEPLQDNKNPRLVQWTEANVKAFDLDASFALYKDRLQDAGDAHRDLESRKTTGSSVFVIDAAQ